MFVVGYGSRRRGDYRKLSDKDVLLIASNWKKLSTEKSRWKREGFSVSCCTTNRATYLIRAGSLFFKHIIDEGFLLRGSCNDFDRLAKQWHPAGRYEDEIEDNLDLLEILHFIPKSNAGLSATLDIVISSVRNILIRKLASMGNYVFSWGGVLGTAVRRGLIKPEDIPVFLIARDMKNIYRQGIILNLSLTYIERLMEGAERAFGNSTKYRFAPRKYIQELPERYRDGTYKQLRALELLCAEYSFDLSLKLFLQWVREPSYFCANGPNKPIKPIIT
jgi:hypothetical protein